MTWQPIETAPKDGTRVDLWVRDHYCTFTDSSHGRVANARFENGKWHDPHMEWGNGGPLGMCARPTHWMPIPAAPPRT